MPGILQGFYGPFPQTMQAAAVDSSSNTYFGEAPKNATLTSKRWSIFQNMQTTALGTATAQCWVTQWPVDPATGLGSDQGIFSMLHATDGTYTYASLGCQANISP